MARTLRVAAAAAGGTVLCFAPLEPLALLGALVVVVLVPGMAMAHALTASEPEADASERAAAAIGGIGLSCVAIWAGAWMLGLSRALVIGAPISAALIVSLLAPAPLRESAAARTAPELRRLCALALVFAVLVLLPFLPYGWQRSDGVHRMGLSDWYLHLSMTTSLDLAPALPPTNPFLFAHKSAYYHYGFHLLAAAIDRAAGRPGDVFPALLVLTLLVAGGFPLVLFAVSRRSLGGDGAKALLAAAAGSLLAGFDLVVWTVRSAQAAFEAWPIPRGVRGLRVLIPSAHLDHWIPHDERQFNAPYVALLWAPHYVAALLMSLLCIHALRSRTEQPALLAAALLLASVPGLSIYMAITTAVAVAAAVAAELWRAGPSRSPAPRRWLVAGAAALVFAAPILLTLRSGTAQHFAPLVVHVSSAGSWQNGAVFTWLLGDHQWTRLLDTPALYFFEFGIVGVLGVAGLARRLRDGAWTPIQHADAVTVAVVFVFLNLVRPPLGGPNNLGFRPMLLVWCLLLPFATEAWLRSTGKLKWIGLALSAAAIPYAAAGATLEGALFFPTSYAVFSVSRWVNANTLPEAVIAIRPADHERSFEYWLRRHVVVAEHRRDALMLGASAQDYDDTRERLEQAYATRDGAAAANRFLELAADVVLVRTGAQGSLPWPSLPCFAERYHERGFAALVRTPDDCRLGGSFPSDHDER